MLQLWNAVKHRGGGRSKFRKALRVAYRQDWNSLAALVISADSTRTADVTYPQWAFFIPASERAYP
jgi:hypothetical protein